MSVLLSVLLSVFVSVLVSVIVSVLVSFMVSPVLIDLLFPLSRTEDEARPGHWVVRIGYQVVTWVVLVVQWPK